MINNNSRIPTKLYCCKRQIYLLKIEITNIVNKLNAIVFIKLEGNPSVFMQNILLYPTSR